MAKIVEIKKYNGRFSISFDESTSTRNRRFINLNLHFSTDFQSLDLIRVVGSMNTERLIQLAKDADLVLAENVIAFTLKKLRDLNTPIGKTVSKI